MTEPAANLGPFGTGGPGRSASRDRGVGEKGEEVDACRCDQKTADGAASNHESGSFCPGSCHHFGSQRTIPMVPESFTGVTRDPEHLHRKPRGNPGGPEKVGRSANACGDLRGRVWHGDERSSTGSGRDRRKRVSGSGRCRRSWHLRQEEKKPKGGSGVRPRRRVRTQRTPSRIKTLRSSGCAERHPAGSERQGSNPRSSADGR